MTLCRHCGIYKASPPRRGLCWKCRSDRAVLRAYPSTSKHAPKTKPWDVVRCRSGPPAEPTPHLPGTPEKVEVLAERFAAGVDLFHPNDTTWGPLE